MSEEKTIWMDREEANEKFGIPEGKTIQQFEQPVWDNITQQWVFDVIVRDV